MSDGSVTIEVELTKEQLEAGLKSLNKDLETLEKPVSSLSKKISNGFSSIGKVATKAGTALTVGLTTPLIALGTAGVKYNAQMEDFQANLTTLLGSADKASEMLNTLKEMANTTPFETTDLLEATQMMLGFGLQDDKTTGYLQTLGDISMGNSEKLMSLTRAFSQIGASGKATMEDINQMIDAGFNPLQIMSEKTGKSMATLRDEVSEGKVSFEDIAGAMQTATSEGGRYYNAMEKASQTMNGKLSTAMDALNTALGNLTQSLLPIVTQVVEKITEWANAFANLDQETQATILKIAGILAVAGPILSIIGKISSGIGTLISIGSKIGKVFSVGSTAIKLLGSALAFLTSPIGIIIAVVGALVGVIIYLWNTNENFRNAIINAWNAVCDFFRGIPGFFQGIWENVKNAFMTAWNSILIFFTETVPNAFSAFINFWIQLGESIKNIFLNAWNAIIAFFTETVPQWIQNIITWFQQLPYNIGIFIGQVFGHIANFGVNAWNWVTTELPQIIQGIIQWFAELPGNIWNWLVETANKIAEWGKNIWDTATTWVSNTINNIVNWFAELPGRIWSWLLNTINNVVTWGQEIWKKATTAISNTINDVVNWFAQLPGRIWSWLLTTVNNIVNWGTDIANKGKEAAQNLFDNIVNTVKEIPGKMLEIGKNIIEGLWNGITGMGSWIKDKISGFAGGIIDGFKKTFGIHSPSLVMNKEIGKYLALGLGQGFEDNIQKVYSKMKSAVDFETQKLSTNLTTQATLKANKDNVKTVNNDNGTVINNTQNFYETNPTPYEQQKQAKQQLRRLAYGL